MRSAPLLDVLAGIDSLNVDEAARRQLRELVNVVGRKHGMKVIEQRGRVEFARRLLDARVSRPTIRLRLIAAHGISASTADRIIVKALNSRKTRHEMTKEPASMTVDE